MLVRTGRTNKLVYDKRDVWGIWGRERKVSLGKWVWGPWTDIDGMWCFESVLAGRLGFDGPTNPWRQTRIFDLVGLKRRSRYRVTSDDRDHPGLPWHTLAHPGYPGPLLSEQGALEE